ncbi:hypothetical protein PIB30_044846 [Stylosanthes scabra]|uniref:Uncharacterized protein n=1 Tax=Stylosanthes scabra TaxID=79078 RepID=A0ABU6YID8_9FABA|nr:hypothetical protein [Stylosanthes scabra]
MANLNQSHLTDCMGQIVGKEDPMDIVTKTGQSIKRLSLYIEDQEKNKMKCTLFGAYVDQVAGVLESSDSEPVVLVAQLFMPNVFMNQVNIQSSFYGSKLLLNPNYPEVVAYRESHVDSYVHKSVSEELIGASNCITTIEEVFNMTKSVSNVADSSVVTVTYSKPTSEPITSLSKDSTLESICESGMATPAKGSLDSIVVNSSLEVLTSPQEKGSNNKSFRHGTKHKEQVV